MTLSVLNERKDGKFTVQYGYLNGRTVRKVLDKQQLEQAMIDAGDRRAMLQVGALAQCYAKMPNRGAILTLHNGIVGDGCKVVATFSSSDKAAETLGCYFDCIDTKDILTPAWLSTWKLNAEVK